MSEGSNKIFVIGAQRTGTASVAEALSILGIKTSHFTHHRSILEDIRAGRFKLQVLQEYGAIADLPVPVYYQELDRHNPGSKFILTLRDPKKWLLGIENHIRSRKLLAVEYDFFGVWEFDRDVFLRRYEGHNCDVLAYFSSRPADLLTFEVEKGDGWEKLCKFLGKPVPAPPFPHKIWGNYAKRKFTYEFYKNFPSLFVRLVKCLQALKNKTGFSRESRGKQSESRAYRMDGRD